MNSKQPRGAAHFFILDRVCLCTRVCVCYRDAPDDAGLSHQVHEGVLHSDQDVGGHPVAAALLDVGARGVRVVTSGRRRSGRHGTVAHRTGTGTRLWKQQQSLLQRKEFGSHFS